MNFSERLDLKNGLSEVNLVKDKKLSNTVNKLPPKRSKTVDIKHKMIKRVKLTHKKSEIEGKKFKSTKVLQKNIFTFKRESKKRVPHSIENSIDYSSKPNITKLMNKLEKKKLKPLLTDNKSSIPIMQLKIKNQNRNFFKENSSLKVNLEDFQAVSSGNSKILGFCKRKTQTRKDFINKEIPNNNFIPDFASPRRH